MMKTTKRQHALEPIKLDAYKPLREVVSETLRQAIKDGVLKPGERLMEIQLADELGVSRTPIREAIRKLELEGRPGCRTDHAGRAGIPGTDSRRDQRIYRQ